MLLNIVQYMRQPPTTKNDLAQNVSISEVEKPHIKLEYFPVHFCCSIHYIYSVIYLISAFHFYNYGH
jgi:hypothetical protein